MAGLLIFCLGYAVCKYSSPTKIITIEKEKTVENRNVVTRTTEKKNPDGSSTTTTVIKDRTIVDSETDKMTVIKNDKAQLKIDALLGYDTKNKEQVYGLQVQKRFAGPVFVGAWGTTQGTLGISAGIEF